MRRVLLFAILLTPAGASRLSYSADQKTGQEAVPAFPTRVEQVIVDAIVTDKKGKSITDLKKEDFTVLEDGVPQTLTSFEDVTLPGAPAERPPAQARIATNTDPLLRTGRTFVIVFDDLHMTKANGERARSAITDFLKTAVREGDRVTLVATGGNAWWTSRMEEGRDEILAMLKRLEGHMVPDKTLERISEWEAMRIKAYNDPDVEARVIRRYVSNGVMDSSQSTSNVMGGTIASNPSVGFHNIVVESKAAEVYDLAVEKLKATLGVLKRVLDSMATSKGRKAVILVSDGFIMDPSLSDFKDVVQSSRRSSVAIYSVNTAGLAALPTEMGAENMMPQADADIGVSFMDASLADEGSDNLALDSGGFSVKSVSNLAGGIERIANESLAYYLIGYTPQNTKRDGKFRKIEVKVQRKDIQVRARRGYYAPSDSTASQKKKEPQTVDPQFQLAVDSPYEFDDIPIRMTAYVLGEGEAGKVKTTIVGDVDLGSFSFKEEGGRFEDTLELLIVAVHRDTGEFWKADQKFALHLLPGTREKFLKTWFPVNRDMDLPSGPYQAKIVVRDKNSGRVGSVSYGFEVPDPASPFHLSSILLTDALKTSPDDPTKKIPVPALIARRTFQEGAEIYGLYTVFGATKEAGSGMPKVSAGYEIRGADGAVKATVPATLVKPTALGQVGRIFGTSLAGIPPGDYDFDLTVKDEVAGKTLEAHEPFTILKGAGAPASP